MKTMKFPCIVESKLTNGPVVCAMAVSSDSFIALEGTYAGGVMNRVYNYLKPESVQFYNIGSLESHELINEATSNCKEYFGDTSFYNVTTIDLGHIDLSEIIKRHTPPQPSQSLIQWEEKDQVMRDGKWCDITVIGDTDTVVYFKYTDAPVQAPSAVAPAPTPVHDNIWKTTVNVIHRDNENLRTVKTANVTLNNAETEIVEYGTVPATLTIEVK